MSRAEAAELPFVRSVLHPTDFSETSRGAFAHALAIALFREADLALLHAGGKMADGDWAKFPPVRRTLEAWRLLEPGSKRSAVEERLGIRVKKLHYAGDPLEATLDYVRSHGVDLLVLGTGQREGLPRWFKQSTAARLSRSSRTLSLLVPEGVRGIVAPEDGHIRLERVLVAVDHTPDPTAALVYASRVCQLVPGEPVTATVLHVGPEMPELHFPENARCRYETEQRSGDVVDQIAAAARELDADLVVMASDGRDGPLDVLRGSFSERAARRVPCPLLIVPQD